MTSMDEPPSPKPSTTFVHADATTFKDLVQRLTGQHDDPPLPDTSYSTQQIAPPKVRVKRPTFKLQERKKGSRSKLTIIKPNLSPPSPSSYLFTPLMSPCNDLSGLRLSDEESPNGSSYGLDENAEERAIKDRRFYLYPLPRSSMPGNVEPELLHLFPLSSPKSV